MQRWFIDAAIPSKGSYKRRSKTNQFHNGFKFTASALLISGSRTSTEKAAATSTGALMIKRTTRDTSLTGYGSPEDEALPLRLLRREACPYISRRRSGTSPSPAWFPP